MAERTYDRLTAQDSSFVLCEGSGAHMHVSVVAIVEPGSLRKRGGGLDIERLREYVESRLHLLPRYRKRLEFTPVQRHPIWVDDPHFDLHYHVRHTALPGPGSEDQLKELAGRILSQQLDREKPLWEIWFIEGLEGDRCAVLSKAHHSMADGITGTSLITALLSTAPDETIEPAPHWVPKPRPKKLQLAIDEVARTASLPFAALRIARDALRRPRQTSVDVAESALAVWQACSSGFRLTSKTPFNQPIGTYRRIDWCALDLAEIKDVKKRLDGTVNDVLLTVVSGAMHRFLTKRHVALDDLEFRVVVPVNTRHSTEDHNAANHVAAWIVRLPVAERDPLAQFAAVKAETHQLRQSKTAQGIDLMLRFADWSGTDLLAVSVMHLASTAPVYNMIVSNIPGPQLPLYLLGARVRAIYPQVPLFPNQGLGIAAMSYCGKVYFEFIADWDLVPDLRVLARAIGRSFGKLKEAAEAR